MARRRVTKYNSYRLLACPKLKVYRSPILCSFLQAQAGASPLSVPLELLGCTSTAPGAHNCNMVPHGVSVRRPPP